MNCPECGSDAAKLPVLETRRSGGTIRRRRRCAKCGWRFSTEEQVESVAAAARAAAIAGLREDLASVIRKTDDLLGRM